MSKILIYDCEIVNCIPTKIRDPRVNYCGGWDDFENMGISVIGTWRNFDTDNSDGEYQAFENDPKNNCYYDNQFKKFELIIKKADLIVGFNSIAFDDKLCYAHEIEITTNFDLLQEVRKASGQPPNYVQGVTRSGYSLNDLAKANLGIEKTGSGELAPKLWQMGHKERVIDYCLNDVKITKELYFKFITEGLIDPTNKQLLKPV